MALAGHAFALSAGGYLLSQRDLGETIVRHGGILSKMVHKRVRKPLPTEHTHSPSPTSPTCGHVQVAFLVATPRAVRRNTQV